MLSSSSIIVHSMVTYTLHTPWTGNQRDHWNFYIRFLSRFISLCDGWDPFYQVVCQAWRLWLSYPHYRKHLQQYTRVSSLWCLYLVTYKIRYCPSYGDFLDRGSLLTKKLISKMLWSIQWSITTLQYPPFAVALKLCTSYYLYSKGCTSYNLYDCLVQVITCTLSLYKL